MSMFESGSYDDMSKSGKTETKDEVRDKVNGVMAVIDETLRGLGLSLGVGLKKGVPAIVVRDDKTGYKFEVR